MQEKHRAKHMRARVLAELGGRCVICGDERGPLVFWYKLPERQRFDINAALGVVDWELLKLEIAKVELRCEKHTVH